MRRAWLYRIAAGLLALFGAGHGAGMLANRSLGPEADAVLAAMKSVTFDFNGSTRSFYSFFFSFGAMVTLFLFLSAFIAWQLAAVAPRDRAVVAPIAWALFVAHVCTAALTWRYFFLGPAVISSVAAAMLGFGAARKDRDEVLPPHR